MKALLLSLLADPFGLSKKNLKLILQVVAEDEGEAAVKEVEAQLIETQVKLPCSDFATLAADLIRCRELTTTRFFI